MCLKATITSLVGIGQQQTCGETLQEVHDGSTAHMCKPLQLLEVQQPPGKTTWFVPPAPLPLLKGTRVIVDYLPLKRFQKCFDLRKLPGRSFFSRLCSWGVF